MKRWNRPVMFNLDNPDDKALSDWCDGMSSNFSGFIKKLIFAAKQNQGRPVAPVAAPVETSFTHESDIQGIL